MPFERADIVALAVALLTPLVLGVVVQAALEPPARPWHSRLRKAPHRPPAAAFPIVWIYAYLAMGYASYLVYKVAKAGAIASTDLESSAAGLAYFFPTVARIARHPLLCPHLLLYYVHYAMLQAWQIIFLYFRNMRVAMVVLMALDIYVPAILGVWRSTVPVAAYILLPYVGWLLLLTYLNYYMLANNPAYSAISFTKDEIIRQHNSPRAENAVYEDDAGRSKSD